MRWQNFIGLQARTRLHSFPGSWNTSRVTLASNNGSKNTKLTLTGKSIPGLKQGIMMNLESIKLFIEYHIDMTRRVWDSIDHITDEQFLVHDAYSQGSIRSLMVHLASTDRRWLAGLKNQPDVGHLSLEDYPTRAAAREISQDVARHLIEYVSTLTDIDLNEHTEQVTEPQW